MAKAPKKERPNLAFALDHAELACHGPASYAPYCLFTPGWLIGYDGVVATGHRVAENMIGLAPETERMRYAVNRAGTPFSISIMSDGKLVVRGSDVKVDVACAAVTTIPNAQPDAPLIEANEQLRSMLKAVALVTTARERHVLAAAVLVKDRSCVGTNGATILEGFHGLDVSGKRMLVPREFVDALAKVKYAVTHAGWSDASFTVWFGEAAWMRTNLYLEEYPDTDVIFARQRSLVTEMRPIAETTLLALETLKPFVEGKVLLNAHGFNTRPDLSGASYTFAHHMLADRNVPYDGMRHCAAFGRYVGFSAEGFYWYGPEVRGITAAPVDAQ